LAKTLYIALKDILVTIRDKPSLAILLAMPMILILILGTALGGGSPEINDIDIVIVNQDRGEIGEKVTGAFTESKELKKLFTVRNFDDAEKARSEVEKGELAAALIIPKDFSDKVNAAKVVKMNIYTDPGQEIPAGIFRSVVKSIASRISAASVAAQTTTSVLSESKMVTSKEDFSRYINASINELSKEGVFSAIKIKDAESKTKRGINAIDYYSAGMGVMFLIFGAMFGAFSFINERFDWTLPRLLITPTNKTSIVGGKMLGIFAIGICQFLILYFFTRLLGAYWGNSLLGVILIAVATIISTTGLSILFAAIAKTRRAIGAIAPLVINIMAIGGGSMLPVEIFPPWLKPLHYFTINGWAIDGFLELMEGATVKAVLPNVAALTGMGMLFFLIGVWRLRYE